MQAQAYTAALIKDTPGFSWHEFGSTGTLALELASKWLDLDKGLIGVLQVYVFISNLFRFQLTDGLTCCNQSRPSITSQESSRVVMKNSHKHDKLQSNSIGKLTTRDTRLFMVPSIKDKDRGEMGWVFRLWARTNAELMKQLDKPESTKPLKTPEMPSECKMICKAFVNPVLAALSFSMDSWGLGK